MKLAERTTALISRPSFIQPVLRHIDRSKNAKERLVVQVRQAGLLECRGIGKIRIAFGARDQQPLSLPGLDPLDDGRRRDRERQLNVASFESDERRRRALIGHVRHLQSGLALEPFYDEV